MIIKTAVIVIWSDAFEETGDIRIAAIIADDYATDYKIRDFLWSEYNLSHRSVKWQESKDDEWFHYMTQRECEEHGEKFTETIGYSIPRDYDARQIHVNIPYERTSA